MIFLNIALMYNGFQFSIYLENKAIIWSNSPLFKFTLIFAKSMAPKCHKYICHLETEW